jgi:uncharacterized membrane protein YphA (DoxX/SURF4 family)
MAETQAASLETPSPQGPPIRWTGWILILGCRYVLGLVFVMAGVSKITDMEGFTQSLTEHSGFDPSWIALIAAGLPWLELTSGLCLLLGYAWREAALIVSVLLVSLSIYSFSHLGARSCGCFLLPGVSQPDTIWWPPARNLLLLAASVLVAWKGRAASRTAVSKGR